MSMRKDVQAKSISDVVALQLVSAHPKATIWDLQARLQEYPPKVVRAKLAALVKRGLLAGCTCGCRGDFEITAAGVESLAQRAAA